MSFLWDCAGEAGLLTVSTVGEMLCWQFVGLPWRVGDRAPARDTYWQASSRWLAGDCERHVLPGGVVAWF